MDDVTIDEARHSYPQEGLTEADVVAMVDASPDGMLLTDEFGEIIFTNAWLESMFGYDSVELVGQSVEILIPERYQKVHTAHRTRYRASAATRPMGSGLDLIACHKDGTEFPVEVSLSPIRAEQGLRVVATVRDITERRAIEAETNAVLYTINATHDGVFIFDPDTLQFSYVNQGAALQLGYTIDELLAMTPLHINPEFSERTYREMLAPLLADEVDSYTVTTQNRRKDGGDIQVEITFDHPPQAGPRHKRLVVALARDISGRLRMERVARTQQIRMEVLEDRERLARDLHDVVIQRLFAAGMGLQAIHPLATEPPLAERITETIDLLDQTITELRSAIFQLTAAPSEVKDLLRQHLEDATAVLGHQPSLEILGDVEAIGADVLAELLPTLTEALSNIARHAQATETKVTIEVGNEAVVLTVSDNGIGIDPTAPRGSGLSNVEARAERLGGVASISSSSKRGTRLSWTAPRLGGGGEVSSTQ